MPPTAILSIESIVTSTALGRRLNCINATAAPPSAESSVKWRRSARAGSVLRRASDLATCGHSKRARGQHYPHDQRLFMAAEHRGDTDESEPEPKGPQAVDLLDEAQVPLANDQVTRWRGAVGVGSRSGFVHGCVGHWLQANEGRIAVATRPSEHSRGAGQGPESQRPRSTRLVRRRPLFGQV